MKSKPLKYLTTAAVIAALYSALTLIAAPISFANIQIRISEALSVLPVFCPPAVAGLTVGCFISNFIGFLIGANPLGFIDCALGTLATFLSALLTFIIGKKIKSKLIFAAAPLPAVVINAVIIGIETAVIFFGKWDLCAVLPCMIYIAAGQIVPCYAGGFVLLKFGKKAFLKVYR